MELLNVRGCPPMMKMVATIAPSLNRFIVIAIKKELQRVKEEDILAIPKNVG